ncbi:hypothetical protein MHJ_0681 [Mesomycoplasma hyopneumoniae J]|uniref:Uncharacterized protein n=1 Tax=Mesomycoplasma hyopneumoniae (strain J / ATCC 25934 / NCTC 10110) TaxID=262719 RepID=Q4AAL4_MESHJ|nr:hypothetical protein MHJ_0681 [Mesomycoplasma hyopneumoniae J]
MERVTIACTNSVNNSVSINLHNWDNWDKFADNFFKNNYKIKNLILGPTLFFLMFTKKTIKKSINPSIILIKTFFIFRY